MRLKLEADGTKQPLENGGWKASRVDACIYTGTSESKRREMTKIKSPATIV